MSKNEQLVVVCSTYGALRAEVIKARLESAGIPAMIRMESQNVIPMTVDSLGKADIMVEQKDEQEARELLAES